ncbi:heavy metal sensor histidine kinase [Janthinobacterium sp.]|uniref:heavy metal sensor histidine kinase n=1 Tax=Janthinobacterium sp. TaxID=1871054 RepID=UPI00263267DE|nr:heavy metal sensor histidine kinase [Janthinobacterium sp.]
MKLAGQSHSLINRLALLFALLTFAATATLGYALYRALEQQLTVRDDAALVNRVDQLRTLLRDVDVVDLIRQKPHLFANMLGNREALLVLQYPGQAPLIEVNPGNSRVPDVKPVVADAPLSLDAVHHRIEPDGTPFIAVSAAAITSHAQEPLLITSGRLLTERTRMLGNYRDQIVLLAAIMSVLSALLAYWIARRGLLPLRKLAEQTGAIGIRNLSVRIDSAGAPQELLPLITGFNGMLDRLESSFTQLSQVSADMAHDLRTPIGNMLGQTEVALGPRRDVEYYQRLLGSNFEELQRLSKMTDSMLFLARAEHADHVIERKAVDVSAEFQRLADYFEGPAEERDVRLVLHGEGTVWADAVLLRRALANLLANAVRYAEPGSEVILAASQDAEGATITVKNKGPTIAEHHLVRLFDRFYRADPSRHASSSSSGLGLAIVRSIMTLHQGKWSAESQDGVTCFSLFFPHEDMSGGNPPAK